MIEAAGFLLPFASGVEIPHPLGLPPYCIGIKATTNESLGFLGRGEGMAALATACVARPEV